MLRTTVTRASTMIKPRLLSTQGECALKKFQEVMHDYRLNNYTQETPRRFKNEIVKAAKGADNLIVASSMQRVLTNIGASHKLSFEELELMFSEVGEEGAIPADRMVQLL